MALHRSHAMNGYVGLLTSRCRKQENSISSGPAPIFSKENAGHAVGQAALIAGQRRKNGLNKGALPQPKLIKVTECVTGNRQFSILDNSVY